MHVPSVMVGIVRPLVLVLACLIAAPLATAQTIPGFGGSTSSGAPADAESDVAAAQLLSVLTDEAARAALIADLERIVAEEEADATGEAETPASTLGRRLADRTEAVAENAVRALARAGRGLISAPERLFAIRDRDLSLFADALAEIAATIAVTVAIFLSLRGLAIPVYRRMGADIRGMPLGRRITVAALAGVLDVLLIVLAAAIGYILAYAVVGGGDLTFRQTLYLNGFVAVELAKAAIRLALAPATADLRPLPLSDRAARRIWRHLNVIVSVIGYTELVVVPIARAEGATAAGNAIWLIACLVVIAYAAWLTLRHRHRVARWIAERRFTERNGEVEQTAFDFGDGSAAPPRQRRFDPRPWLTARWHWFALSYLAVLSVLVLIGRDGNVLGKAVRSGILVALAIGLASWVMVALRRRAAEGVVLPDFLDESLPTLKPRLENMLTPATLILRAIIAFGTLAFILAITGAVDVSGRLDSAAGRATAAAVLTVLVVLSMAWLAWIVLASWIDSRLQATGVEMASPREQTLLALLRNASLIALVIFALMFILPELGLNIGPVIASAGVVGLAIGFGAQKLVQDIITGIFIQFENSINVGDVVTAGAITGAVERLTVRSVSLRDLDGIYHTVPFSSVDMVSNFTRGFSYWVVDMGVAYKEDVAVVKTAMFDAFDELRADPTLGPAIIDELEWFGLDAFGDSAVVLKCRIRTQPGKQWAVGRGFNEVIKRTFDERGIEIPFPHRTIYYGEAQTASPASEAPSLGGGAALHGSRS